MATGSIKFRRFFYPTLVFVGCLISLPAAFGQEAERPEAYADLPVTSLGSLRFFMDVSGFRGPEGYTRQEVSLLVDAKQLKFVDRDGDEVAEIALVAAVVDSVGERASDETWVRTISVDGLEGLGEAWAPFRDVVRFDLKPGVYRVLVQIKDVHGHKEGRCETRLRVRDFERPELVFSDIQFASSLARSGTSHRFVKQGWKVAPNTTRNYLTGKPLSIYFELYNFSDHPDLNEESFILGYSLVDSSGFQVKSYPAKRYLKPGESVVKAEILETEGLPEGTYSIQIEAFDGKSREYVRARRQVFLFPSRMPEGLTQIQKDLLRYYMDIRYVADGKTQKMYDSLEDWPSRMVFLQAFWKKLDTSPEAPINERLVEHLLRMSRADERFYPGRGKRGSDTDRGRVYVQYGPPADIDYHTSAAGQNPYEVWIYEHQGRHEFVFQDRKGTGVYELVHSTYPGELYNPYWHRGF